MSQTELVAMLRSKARKSGTQTSHYRGVSLLKQTGKWHAQINVGGKQVLTRPHLLLCPFACKDHLALLLSAGSIMANLCMPATFETILSVLGLVAGLAA